MTNIYHLILLDESGSMTPNREYAISAINETIQTIKSAQKQFPDQNNMVSFVTFSGNGTAGIRPRRLNVPAEQVEELTAKDYVPNACTPLYDAIGLSVDVLSRYATDDDVVLVTIITDGMENSSARYSRGYVNRQIESLREKGWTFTYLGANQDAKEVSSELGIENALNFDATEEGIGKMAGTYCSCLDKKMGSLTHDKGALKDCKSFFDDNA